MKITKDIITDLLPLYFSNECSPDTKKLVDEYLQSDPEFAKQAELSKQHPIPDSIPQGLGNNDEMAALKKTQRMIKMRSYFMGFAIFFSLVPFSFFHGGGKTYIFFVEAPLSAIIYGTIGLAFWVSYFIVKKKSSDL